MTMHSLGDLSNVPICRQERGRTLLPPGAWSHAIAARSVVARYCRQERGRTLLPPGAWSHAIAARSVVARYCRQERGRTLLPPGAWSHAIAARSVVARYCRQERGRTLLPPGAWSHAIAARSVVARYCRQERGRTLLPPGAWSHAIAARSVVARYCRQERGRTLLPPGAWSHAIAARSVVARYCRQERGRTLLPPGAWSHAIAAYISDLSRPCLLVDVTTSPWTAGSALSIQSAGARLAAVRTRRPRAWARMTDMSADVVRATDRRTNVGRRGRCPRWGCGESESAAASALLRSRTLPRREEARRWVTRKAMRLGSRIGRPGLRRRIVGPPTRRRRWFRNNRHPLDRFARPRRDLQWPGSLTGTPGTAAGRSRHSYALRTTQHRQGDPRPRGCRQSGRTAMPLVADAPGPFATLGTPMRQGLRRRGRRVSRAR